MSVQITSLLATASLIACSVFAYAEDALGAVTNQSEMLTQFQEQCNCIIADPKAGVDAIFANKATGNGDMTPDGAFVQLSEQSAYAGEEAGMRFSFVQIDFGATSSQSCQIEVTLKLKDSASDLFELINSEAAKMLDGPVTRGGGPVGIGGLGKPGLGRAILWYRADPQDGMLMLFSKVNFALLVLNRTVSSTDQTAPFRDTECPSS